MRSTLAMLFNFAASEGYLPADHKGVPRPGKRRRAKLSVQMFSPEEMSKLLNAASGDQLVALPDPFVGVKGHWLIRRLAPDCSRIELGSLPKTRDELRLLHAMGQETANIHLGTEAAARRALKDLKRRPGKWLGRAAEAMAEATLQDWKGWAKGQ